MAGSQLLQLLHTDETEQKSSDAEILCGRDRGLQVPSRCGCKFLTGTAFPLVPPEFEHCTSVDYCYFMISGLRPFLTVLIKTPANNPGNRQLLRETWIKDIKKHKLNYAFLIGKQLLHQHKTFVP